MSETPQAKTGASEVPSQTRGQERVPPPEARPQHRGEAPPREATAWVGWIIFAGIIMIMMGSFQAIAGVVALFDSGYFLVGEERLLVNVDYTAWGWVHLVLGVVAVATAFGLLSGKMWARVLGIGIALLSAVVNLAFTAAYPFWAVTMITLDVIVIYAIAVHGGELKPVEQ